MKLKHMILMGILLMGILAVSGLVSAIPATIESVKIDNDEITPGNVANPQSYDKGDEFEVKVKVQAQADVDDVEIAAYLRGYDHDDRIYDVSSVFDMKAGNSYIKKLNLRFPQRIDQDRYTLRVEVAGRSGSAEVQTYELDIETERNQVVIKDVVLSPNSGVVAGRALLATVRVQNYGKHDEDDVKVTFSVPELGISASDYIDELEKDGDDDDQKSTEELYLRIPQCTKAGVYDADVLVQFDDLERSVRKALSVEVFEDETCGRSAAHAPSMDKKPVEGKTVISVGPESQDVAKSAGGVIYPVTVTNTGSAKTYTVSVTGGDWGTFRVSPTNVITVDGDETKTVYIYAAANQNAAEGTQVFGVSIKSGDKVIKDVTLKANVVGGSAAESVSLKRALEIGLIVLVVILVILALIIGFNKLKGDDEDKEDGESYY